MEDIKIKKPKVFVIEESSSRAVVKAFSSLNRNWDGNVAVKISSDEKGGLLYNPQLVNRIVSRVDGSLVDGAVTNKSGMDLLSKGLGQSVDVLDTESEIQLQITEKEHLRGVCFVGERIQKYKHLIVLSHFGEPSGEYLGAVKNMSIGMASRYGKAWVYSAGFTKDPDVMWEHLANEENMLESVAEAGKGVIDYFSRGNIVYINYLGAEDARKSGKIFAGLDPVAVDTACFDAVKERFNPATMNYAELKGVKNMELLLECSEKLALGNRDYELIKI